MLDLENILLLPSNFTRAAKDMPCVIIESPFKAKDKTLQVEYHHYLNLALRDSISRGESPYASHAFIPRVLNDDNQNERSLGINLGQAWLRRCDFVAVYQDYGISEGMKAGIASAEILGKPIEYRSMK